jgi:hypothetical protein
MGCGCKERRERLARLAKRGKDRLAELLKRPAKAKENGK